MDPLTQWDFFRLCTALQAHRRANPQFKLSTNLGMIQNEVDQENAARVAAMPNAESYIINDQGAIPFQVAPDQTSRLQAVAAAVRKVKSGAEVLLSWEKSGDRPVEQSHAEARALVCATCPKNEKGDFTRWFTVPFSELIRKQVQRLTELKLQTSLDDKLNVCSGCLCPLRLKIWTPAKHVLEHLTPEIEKDLQQENPRCWVLQEKDKQ